MALAADDMRVVAQKGRDFALKTVELHRGGQIRFTNEDGFLHQLFIHSPNLTFDSNEQGPGEVVDVAFPKAGDYTVLCGIHPKMKLAVHVE
jgi:plastocyanin